MSDELERATAKYQEASRRHYELAKEIGLDAPETKAALRATTDAARAELEVKRKQPKQIRDANNADWGKYGF